MSGGRGISKRDFRGDGRGTKSYREISEAEVLRARPEEGTRAGYLQRLRIERGYSEATLTAYRRDLGALPLSTPSGEPIDEKDVDWSRIDANAIRAEVAGMSRAGASPASVARRLSAWRGFFDHLAEQHAVESNPVRAVRAPRRGTRLPKALAVDQMARLLDGGAAPTALAATVGEPATAQAQAFETVRDQAMIELFYSSGLRLAELVSLDIRFHSATPAQGASVSWIDLDARQCTVLGKGGRRRSVPMGPQACQALRQWLTERETWAGRHSMQDLRALFITRRGTRISHRAVQQRVERYSLGRADGAHVHPHVFRHSFASHVLQSSGDLRAVQELLGHKDITSTQVYTALDFQRLAAVYDQSHPRARRKDGNGSGT